jgi:hypothetical protein
MFTALWMKHPINTGFHEMDYNTKLFPPMKRPVCAAVSFRMGNLGECDAKSSETHILFEKYVPRWRTPSII